MVNRMRAKYAYGTVNMMVTAVARAAKDFGWGNPRDDEVLTAMMQGLKNLKGLNKKKQQAMLAEHVAAIMTMRKEAGMALELWILVKAMVIVGWMAFLQVSEMVGSGRYKGGEPKDGPSGLDVCDVAVMVEKGKVGRMELSVRSAKNDQSMEGYTTTVYADELQGEGCAIRGLQEWLSVAGLLKQKGCTKGRTGCKVCGRPKCVCDCKQCGKLFRNVVHGKVGAMPVSRAGLTMHLKKLYVRLEG